MSEVINSIFGRTSRSEEYTAGTTTAAPETVATETIPDDSTETVDAADSTDTGTGEDVDEGAEDVAVDDTEETEDTAEADDLDEDENTEETEEETDETDTLDGDADLDTDETPDGETDVDTEETLDSDAAAETPDGEADLDTDEALDSEADADETPDSEADLVAEAEEEEDEDGIEAVAAEPEVITAGAAVPARAAAATRGNTSVDDEVVSKVVDMVARKADGVHDLGEVASVAIEGDVATIKLSLVIVFGHAVKAVAEQLRVDVIEAVEQFLGLDVAAVDVRVSDIHLPVAG
ncbi:Asp23/Gls24 family envelope stress response protein [Amycolatopsis sp. 195334CR]|uniref:Asp23/Gls24 family envelope stress response protein n=1 Tax=Amycolatopsis sp. 195334CR TaxID=2814588 RepID=UPI001A8D98EA|nr:Asp23/Gls24 family envelope stress response protein [Amycolatopsis sp. 195334CR]MBN6038966.1 Asp23/Gls24 family envelope stress response protein [Amycolatopsis sp. 195334CR]